MDALFAKVDAMKAEEDDDLEFNNQLDFDNHDIYPEIYSDNDNYQSQQRQLKRNDTDEYGVIRKDTRFKQDFKS